MLGSLKLVSHIVVLLVLIAIVYAAYIFGVPAYWLPIGGIFSALAQA